jgi:alanine dehydrogenase
MLLSKRINAIGFEYIRGEENHLPIVSAMSEIAGLVSITIAAEYLSNAHGGKGILLGGVSGVSPTEVAIVGTGTAAEFAARAALGLGARVRILGNSPYKLRRLQHHMRQPIFTSLTQPKVLAKALTTADVVIGAIDMNERDEPIVITDDMIRGMKPGSVVIDLSIDQGGCFSTSRITTHASPVFREHGIVHYGVTNIASRVSRTASIALSNILAPILIDIGNAGGVREMLRNDIGLRRGVYIYQGILTNSFIGRRFGLPSQNIDLLMAAL